MKTQMISILFGGAMLLTASVYADVNLKNAVIVHPDAMKGWEKDAVNDMQTALEKISGGKYAVLPESRQPANGVRIFIGNTRAAAKAGIDVKKLESQEFQIKTAKDAVYIAGGTPTGTSYGVSSLLEDEFGVYQFGWNCFSFPKNPNPAVKDQNRRVKPAITDRGIYNMLLSSRLIPPAKSGWHQFYRRNRIDWPDADRTMAGYRLSHGTRGCHSFFQVVPPKKYFKDHPEYYSMKENGVRAWFPTGQLCPTNKGMREVAYQFFMDLIKKDRAKDPVNYPTLYELSQEDNTYYICKCPECLAMVKKYGGENALIMDFVNDIATRVAKTYPDVWFRTFAYTCTEKPLKGIDAAKNVVVQYCDLYGFSDHMYPLTDPVNKDRCELFKTWIKKAPDLQLWDYILGWGALTAVDSIIADARFFHECGLKRYFNETEYNYYLPQPFHILQYFLQAQLLYNPDKDPEKLIDLFITNYYGAAAPEIKEFLTYLRMAQKKYRTSPQEWKNVQMAHLKHKEVLETARAILNRGLKKVEKDPELAGRVAREMACFLKASFPFYRHNAKFKKEADALAKEYEKIMMLHYNTAPYSDKYRKEMIDKFKLELSVVNMKFTDLPPEVAKLPESKYIAVPYIYLSVYLHGAKIKDEDSSQPLVATWYPAAGVKFKLPASIGAYANIEKRCIGYKITEAPADEKYHWYKIGVFSLDRKTILFVTDWHLGFKLDDFYTLADGMDYDPNKYEIWMSVKMQGPSYVPGSKKPDAFRIDRALLVKQF